VGHRKKKKMKHSRNDTRESQGTRRRMGGSARQVNRERREHKKDTRDLLKEGKRCARETNEEMNQPNKREKKIQVRNCLCGQMKTTVKEERDGQEKERKETRRWARFVFSSEGMR